LSKTNGILPINVRDRFEKAHSPMEQLEVMLEMEWLSSDEFRDFLRFTTMPATTTLPRQRPGESEIVGIFSSAG
jgi:hypothetical protein